MATCVVGANETGWDARHPDAEGVRADAGWARDVPGASEERISRTGRVQYSNATSGATGECLELAALP